MRIGFVGLGTMGRPMALNLIKGGHQLTVHDLVPDSASELIAEGAVWAATPREVGVTSELTLTALPGPAEVEAAVLGPDGLLGALSANSVYIDMSTSTPATIERIAELAKQRGIGVLDAPVSGGVRGARKGTLVFMVGGDHDVFLRCEPVLRCMGESVFHMGDLGTGYIAKLVNNYMGMSNAVAAMEAMTLGTKAGVKPGALLDVVNAGTGASHMSKTLFPYLIFPRKFEPTRFSMELGAKDLRLAVDLAHELGVPVKVGDTVAEALKDAVAQGLGAKDFSTYITLLEGAAGVVVEA